MEKEQIAKYYVLGTEEPVETDFEYEIGEIIKVNTTGRVKCTKKEEKDGVLYQYFKEGICHWTFDQNDNVKSLDAMTSFNQEVARGFLEKTPNPNTKKVYEALIKGFLSWTKKVIYNVTDEDIDTYSAILSSQGKSTSHIKTVASVIRSMILFTDKNWKEILNEVNKTI